jgi:single stranded DNA-binding protein
MNFDQNFIAITGRVVRPLDLKKTTKEGKSWGYLHIATTHSWKDKDTKEKKEKTTWHSVKVWGVCAENAAKYLKKGQQVRIEGRMVSDEAEVDGKKVYYYYPQAENVFYGYEARGDKKEDAKPSAPPKATNNTNVDIAAVMKQLEALNQMVNALKGAAVPAAPPEPEREAVVPSIPDEGTYQASAGM